MVYYVTQKYDGSAEDYAQCESKLHEMQTADAENTYISPVISFSYLEYGEMGDTEQEMRYDLMCACDAVIVVGDTTRVMRGEIELAERLDIEVIYVDN